MSVGLYRETLTDYIDYIKAFSVMELEKVCEMIKGSLVFTAGNGGSSGNAEHLACELQKMCDIPTICLNTSMQLITAHSNDENFDKAMVRQYKTMRRVLGNNTVVVYSTSGESQNIISLADEVVRCEDNLIAMTGYDQLGRASDHSNTLDDICRRYGDRAISLCINISKFKQGTRVINATGTQVSEDIHGMINHIIYIRLHGGK